MVRHQHIAVADIAVGRERARHIHVALGRERFPEVTPVSPEFVEMRVEQFAALAEPADNTKAMDNGLTQTEAGEVITQLAFYTGWPNAFSALPVAKDVFAKRTGQNG